MADAKKASKGEPEGSVLLVDDEATIVRALSPALRHAGYAVEVAETGEEALKMLAQGQYDVVLLDLGLPGMDGQEVIARIREWSELPIIVLSARELEDDKIEALDGGADDYVSKPFAIGELLARVRASIRGRSRRFGSTALFRAAGLQIDFATRQVSLDGAEVRLTPREYEFMRALAANAGKVVTHKQLIAAVWGANSNADAQFVRVLAGQVRQKVEADPSRPQLVRTEPGIGYRLIAET